MARQVRPEVLPMPLPVLVELVNAWGDAPRAAAGESGEPPPDVTAFRAGAAEYWEGFGRLSPGDLTRVANLIRPVFASDSGVECTARLNQLMAQAAISPEFGADEWTVREGGRPSAGAAPRVGSAHPHRSASDRSGCRKAGHLHGARLRRCLRRSFAGSAPPLLLSHLPEPQSRTDVSSPEARNSLPPARRRVMWRPVILETIYGDFDGPVESRRSRS